MSLFSERSDLLSWGRIPSGQTHAATPHFADQIQRVVSEGSAFGNGTLGVGLRRSYGDTCVNLDGSVIEMTHLDHVVSFDRNAGLLVAEAGLSLSDLLAVTIPAGFFLPVAPGTQFVTLGGAVANDVHGKNHHRAGTIGNWVRRLDLIRSDGSRVTLAPDEPSGLFRATIGGLGLTGLISHVALQLKPISSSNLDVETIPFSGLDEFFALAADSEDAFEYTVAWVDCLGRGTSMGRGIFSRANHATDGDLSAQRSGRLSVPIDAPSFLLNRVSLKLFNQVYYSLAGRARSRKTPYASFFFPLDSIADWNRLYGRSGFYQYQSVVPKAAARAAGEEMLRVIAASGQGSFLAVMKTFGHIKSPGMMSFPMEGMTLALDFANRGQATLSLLDRLDAIVREAGGRLYPAKDGRFPASMLESGYPELDTYRTFLDPKLSSCFRRRMKL